MPYSKALAALKKAIAEEAASTSHQKLCADLLTSIVQYQAGKGPAPTVAQFVAWRDALDRSDALAGIKRGPSKD